MSGNGGELDIEFRRSLLVELSEIKDHARRGADAHERTELSIGELAHEMGHVKDHLTEQSLRFADLSSVKPNGLRTRRVLIVEDDTMLLDTIARQLARLGCIVSSAVGTREAEALLLHSGRYDVALIDLRLPTSSDGLALCRHLSRYYADVGIVVMSGKMPAGINLLPVVTLCKPFSIERLLAALNDAIGHGGASRRTTDYPPAFAGDEGPTLESTTFLDPEDAETPTRSETPDAKKR